MKLKYILKILHKILKKIQKKEWITLSIYYGQKVEDSTQEDSPDWNHPHGNASLTTLKYKQYNAQKWPLHAYGLISHVF